MFYLKLTLVLASGYYLGHMAIVLTSAFLQQYIYRRLRRNMGKYTNMPIMTPQEAAAALGAKVN